MNEYKHKQTGVVVASPSPLEGAWEPVKKTTTRSKTKKEEPKESK